MSDCVDFSFADRAEVGPFDVNVRVEGAMAWLLLAVSSPMSAP